MSSRKRRDKGWVRIATAVVLGMALVVAGAAVAFAKGGGGTAKPPVGATSPFVTPTLADPRAIDAFAAYARSRTPTV